MYFPYKNEYRILKCVEITIRRGLSRKEKSRGNELIWVIIHTYKETPCIAILTNKNAFFKNTEQEG
jgi:hypothetical protein